jgi:hypothetical protein
MSASQNNLSLILNQQDAKGVNILNRLIGAITFAGVAGEFHNGILTGVGSVTLDLPTAIILQLYFKNTHATAVITLTGTIQGGASQAIAKIQPGSVIVNWCAQTGSLAGYTALSVQSDTAGATFEMFLGG